MSPTGWVRSSSLPLSRRSSSLRSLVEPNPFALKGSLEKPFKNELITIAGVKLGLTILQSGTEGPISKDKLIVHME